MIARIQKMKKPFEQPNQTRKGNIEGQNLMIIEEIEGLMSQVSDKVDNLNMLVSMDDSKQSKLISQAFEEINLFQKTTLFKLRKTFE